MSEPMNENKENLPSFKDSSGDFFPILALIILNICLFPVTLMVVAVYIAPSFVRGFDSITLTILGTYIAFVAVLILEVVIFRKKALLIVNFISALIPLLVYWGWIGI